MQHEATARYHATLWISQLFQFNKFVFVFSRMMHVMAVSSSSLGPPLWHQSSPLDRRYRLLTIADIEGYKAS